MSLQKETLRQVNHLTRPARCALLIPHYENVAGLMRSLSSIGPTEWIDVFIVDDGSAAKIDEQALNQVFRATGTITCIYLPYNKGIQAALNTGLDKIGYRYEYIARLDCGDYCAPHRFSQQMQFLDQHPHIALVGTAVTFVDRQKQPLYTLQLPTTSAKIRQAMHINCAFIHPTVMWRTCMAQQVGNYPDQYPLAEDFAFFWQVVQRFDTANLSEVLVWSEIRAEGLSVRHRRQQLRSRLSLLLCYFQWNLTAIYGILKTLILFVIPFSVVIKVKMKRSIK